MRCILTLSSVRVVGTLECLPSNPSFDKQISGRKKGGGVRGVGQWVPTSLLQHP